MKRREFLKNTATLAALSTLSLGPAHLFADGQKRKVLYFDRSNSYVHPPTVTREDGTTICGEALAELGKELNFEVVATKDSSVFDGDLTQFDAFVFYTCGELDKDGGESPAGMSKKGVFNFYNAIRGGVGFIGIHSATDTWKTPGEGFVNQPECERTEYIKMIGGQFIVHGSQQETTLKVVQPAQLPYLASVGKEFRYFDEWYTLKNFNPDIHVLVAQETKGMNIDDGNACYNRPAYPCVWARMEGKGRVAYSSLGHNNSSFWDPTVRGIMSDLLQFVLKDVDIDLTPNMAEVTPGANTLPK